MEPNQLLLGQLGLDTCGDPHKGITFRSWVVDPRPKASHLQTPLHFYRPFWGLTMKP